MNDTPTVCVVESLTERDEPVHRVLDLEDFLFPQDAPVAFPLDELHTDEGFVPVEAEIVDGDDIGVVQRGGRSRFVEELFACRRILRERFGQDLVGDGTFEQMIVGFVDGAHPSFAEHPGDLVARRLFGGRDG
jgi:hypothetical protein